MKTEEILTALRRLKVETGSLACMGCGYEHDCGVHGCRIVREAADLIEKLTGRCARYAEKIAVLQEREKWVAVTERLPDQCMDILVSYRDGHILMGTAMCDDWIEEDLEDGKITHWMPLPDVPEVE
jgi:hypothetical protein